MDRGALVAVTALVVFAMSRPPILRKVENSEGDQVGDMRRK